MLRHRHSQTLLNLKGNGKDCWSDKGAPAFVQPLPARGGHNNGHRTGFRPQQLRQGDAIAFDGSALVAFMGETNGTGLFLEPLLRGIAQGTWRGVISSLSLAAAIELAIAIAAGAAVLVSDNPQLAQTEQHPVLSALHR